MGWQSIRIVGVSSCVILILLQKIQKMVNKDIRYHTWLSPCGCPHMLCKQEGGKPSQNAAQPCARAHGYINDNLMADGLRKGWGFRVGTWNADSLTVEQVK